MGCKPEWMVQPNCPSKSCCSVWLAQRTDNDKDPTKNCDYVWQTHSWMNGPTQLPCFILEYVFHTGDEYIIFVCLVWGFSYDTTTECVETSKENDALSVICSFFFPHCCVYCRVVKLLVHAYKLFYCRLFVVLVFSICRIHCILEYFYKTNISSSL